DFENIFASCCKRNSGEGAQSHVVPAAMLLVSEQPASRASWRHLQIQAVSYTVATRFANLLASLSRKSFCHKDRPSPSRSAATPMRLPYTAARQRRTPTNKCNTNWARKSGPSWNYGQWQTMTDSRGGGRGGIRTHGGREPTPVFKTGALNRSATRPCFVF